ncbi:FGGY-family carbohydrate kinase [Spiribacter curvatus]|uniref:FGGY-family carbohydrate kinase n=1 Tax=Spiribacter curvatus TaxID=1335757 RepID=UPI0003F71A16|nr:FGGY-family carbohydrate kinase [Spiribacter curvatus]
MTDAPLPSFAPPDPREQRMPSLLGIDSGLTVTKAVIFDECGRSLAVSRERVPQSLPRAHHVERDMDELWRATARAIREAIRQSGRGAADIAAVAPTAHGDGLYLVDRTASPLGPGILSLDSRARLLLREWQNTGVMEPALKISGQQPHVAAPSTLLAWIRDHHPERYTRIGHVLGCKDWLRLCLTGELGMDRTEASTAFTDVSTQSYSSELLELFGLGALQRALPPMYEPVAISGQVTAAAAAATGLLAGTPVAAGLHDVTASALGIGAHAPDILGIVAGTYSINEVVSNTPVIDSRWFCRGAVRPGQWNNMAISPASATNYDWFIDTLCASDRDAAAASGLSIHEQLSPEIAAGLARPASPFYHPYLYGSPDGAIASAGFLGLRGWHQRGDMLAAILEGIAFNHRVHVDALREAFPATEIYLTGGISRNPLIAQLFSDVLGLPVTVTDTEEAAAWGAALCAGAAVGLFKDVAADPRVMSGMRTKFWPDPQARAVRDERYKLHQQIAHHLRSDWEALSALEPSKQL